MPSNSKEIKLANPRGFCAGVDRAIDIVNKALEIYGSPVYVKHEVVHNKYHPFLVLLYLGIFLLRFQ